MTTFVELQERARDERAGLRELQLAIAADSATQFLSVALRGAAVDRGIRLRVLELPLATFEHQIQDPTSELHRARPDMVLVWRSSPRCLTAFQATAPGERGAFAESLRRDFARLADGVSDRIGCPVLCFNLPELDDGVFGSFANSTRESWPFQVRSANVLLMELAATRGDLFIVDLVRIVGDAGWGTAYDPRLAVLADCALAPDILPVIAERTLDVMDAIEGRIRKCLVLDLDDTLWGGSIGEDGPDHIELGQLGLGAAFLEIQRWAKELTRRGVLVAICSKNFDHVAREPFERHPDMVLRMQDIAVFRANWNSKADNLIEIQSILGIGFDSMVFVDDSPAEREAVRQRLPEVCVPEIPEDPAYLMPFLARLNLFETASVSSDDSVRTRRYQEADRRHALRRAASCDDDFLATLDMVCRVEGLTSFNIPRVAQLTQRSNQFNLRTVRYTEGDLGRIRQSAHHHSFVFSLRDRVGDYGIVGFLLLEGAEEGMFIDTWLMSCRALKRGLEHFVLEVAIGAARERLAPRLIGEYIATAKNVLVRDHYAEMGFTARDGLWYLEVEHAPTRHHFIRRA